MKIIIFAGGSGTRFWPISRNKFPKQFIPIVNNESTLQRQLGHLAPVYKWNNILVPTTELLATLVKNNFPQLPLQNIITEPVRRDLAPAVGLSMIKLKKMGAGAEAVAILWSDNVIQSYDNFFKAMQTAEEFMKEDPNRLIFLGEKPTFANENLGWIELGDEVADKFGIKVYKRKGFTYRPSLSNAKKWFEAGSHLWNPGYFVTTPDFLLSQYKLHTPEMYQLLMKIYEALDTDKENEVLQEVYPKMENISFDDAILMRMDNELTLVLAGEYKWSDPGTLYALKEFLQEKESDNVTKGLVYNSETKDSLTYNYVKKQLLVTIGLDGFIVVNTPDAILVCHKDQIPNIKKVLKEFEGTELDKYL